MYVCNIPIDKPNIYLLSSVVSLPGEDHDEPQVMSACIAVTTYYNRKTNNNTTLTPTDNATEQKDQAETKSADEHTDNDQTEPEPENTQTEDSKPETTDTSSQETTDSDTKSQETDKADVEMSEERTEVNGTPETIETKTVDVLQTANPLTTTAWW